MRRLVLLSVLLSLLGCTRGGEVSIGDVKRDLKKAVDTTEKYIRETQADAQQRLADQLRDLDVDLDAWKARLKDATAEQRPALEKQLRALEQKRADLGRQIDDLRAHPGETWDQARAGVDRAMAELKKSLHGAAEKVRP